MICLRAVFPKGFKAGWGFAVALQDEQPARAPRGQPGDVTAVTRAARERGREGGRALLLAPAFPTAPAANLATAPEFLFVLSHVLPCHNSRLPAWSSSKALLSNLAAFGQRGSQGLLFPLLPSPLLPSPLLPSPLLPFPLLWQGIRGPALSQQHPGAR